jgi:DNA-directed RNA polymerase specialized sigma24 family protein
MIDEQPVDAVTVVSFDDFFRSFEPVLSRALAAGFGFEAGRDAAAEALGYAWQNWARVSAMDNPEGYMYRIAERSAMRGRRRRQGLFAVPPSTDGVPFEPALAPALTRLSLRQRQAVVLVAAYGLTHAEAAALLGIAASSIQNHVERGMNKLKHSLGAHHDR